MTVRELISCLEKADPFAEVNVGEYMKEPYCLLKPISDVERQISNSSKSFCNEEVVIWVEY